MNAREIRMAELEGEIENATTALENQISEYKEKGANLLIILGIIAAAYVLYRILASSDEENGSTSTKSHNKEDSAFTSAIWGILGTVILGVAKDKISGFLNQIINDTN